MTIHERIAAAIGWPLRDVRSMSFHALREIVRFDHPALAEELSERIALGDYVIDRMR